jgi:hypothetical protein
VCVCLCVRARGCVCVGMFVVVVVVVVVCVCVCVRIWARVRVRTCASVRVRRCMSHCNGSKYATCSGAQWWVCGYNLWLLQPKPRLARKLGCCARVRMRATEQNTDTTTKAAIKIILKTTAQHIIHRKNPTHRLFMLLTTSVALDSNLMEVIPVGGLRLRKYISFCMSSCWPVSFIMSSFCR